MSNMTGDELLTYAVAAVLAAVVCWPLCEPLAPLWHAARRLTRNGLDRERKLVVRTRSTIFSSMADLSFLLGFVACYWAFAIPFLIVIACRSWKPAEEFVHAVARLIARDAIGEVYAVLVLSASPTFILFAIGGLCHSLEWAWNTATCKPEDDLEILEERSDLREVAAWLLLVIPVVILLASKIVVEWLDAQLRLGE